MGFSPDFLEEIRSRLPASEVVGKKVRLVRKGREHSGLCPFHNEKSPSFTVNDDKAFYHCFGCGAHGDIIRFVTETEGLSFPEAVERLAGQAGLPMPEYTPEDRVKTEKRKNLYDVMEAATQWFQSQLRTRAGKEGLDYLLRRGLSEPTIRNFRLGFSQDSRTALKDAMLARDGITEDMLVEAGLLIRPEVDPHDPPGTAKETYDRFRHRVMFPITDRQGRVVAFGGRALSSDAKAKYLNSPETPLFHKGRLLYNLAGARKAAYDIGRVLVAEGYMDVIALAQAGFDYAVAPLGTAVTEEQIGELWRLAPEPLLCFDGDRAGLKAAERVVERALPLLKPGHSLRFVYLPEGEDPDSFVQGHGARAFSQLLEEGKPLATVLWNMLIRETPAETPEQRAGLQQSIQQTLAEIKHETIRGYYQNDFRKRLQKYLGEEVLPENLSPDRPSNGARGGDSGENRFVRLDKSRSWKSRGAPKEPEYGVRTLKDTARGKVGARVLLDLERLMILTILNHPFLLEAHHEDLAVCDFESQELDKLRNEIIRISIRDSDLDRESLHRHLIDQGYGKAIEVIFDQEVLKADWFAWPDAALQDVEQGWLHVVNRKRLFVLEKEKQAVEQELAENMTDEVFARFQALNAEIEDARRVEASMDEYGIASGKRSSS
ncbi:DNA primase [Emcibacter sp.]|uniref:DNA primase n=1 Tax=Emcibacter sp. TaxID=1979954 RepID=UPI002AA7FA0B|nr:DNA primase [Emcibacter sp.]